MNEAQNTPGLPFSVTGMIRVVKQYGWSLVLSALLVVAAIYGAVSFVPTVYGDLSDLKTGMITLQEQHQGIAPKLEEGNRIQCATCWNSATNAEEIRRCSCNPQK